MPFSFQNGPIAGPVIQALCWTLIHSLWQGLLAAVVAGAIIVGTKKSSARVRYALLSLLFFGFMAVSAGTFVKLLRQSSPVNESPAHVDIRMGYIPSGFQRWTFTPAPSGSRIPAAFDNNSLAAEGQNDARSSFTGQTVLTTRLETYCNDHALIIVTLWMIFLVVKLLRTGASLTYIHRIRRYKTSLPPEFWARRIGELATGLGMQRPVQLLESGMVAVPIVIGFLKPIVLVPLGILADLPPEQLEAVLLHELAHIRRKDYLVNLLQHFAEALFFFNPALLWISSLIREERENCCDDVAIGATRNKSQLIHALVAFQEYGERIPGVAVAFPGRKTHLLDRVKRIVYNRNKTLNAMEKVFLAACFLITGSLTVAFSSSFRQGPKNEPLRAIALTQDTIPRSSAPISGAPTQSPYLYNNSGARDTVPPVAPVPPVGSPAEPIQPASDITTPVLPVTPVTPITPINAIVPVAPLAPLGHVSSVTYPESELQGGNFDGSLEIRDHKIIYARGIWEKGNVVKYFSDNYEIVKQNGQISRIIYRNSAIPKEKMEDNIPVAKALIEMLESEQRDMKKENVIINDSQNGYGKVSGNYRDAAKGYTYSTSGDFKVAQQDSARAALDRQYLAQDLALAKSNSGSGSQSILLSNIHITSSLSGQTTESGNVSGQDIGVGNQSANDIGVGNQSGQDIGVGNSTSVGSSSGPSSHGDANDPIVRDILQDKLASDPKHLTFTLDNKRFVVNGVKQPDSVFQRFKAKYVQDQGNSYGYVSDDNSVSSTVRTHH